MRIVQSRLFTLLILLGLVLISSCSKDDPAPLAAQKNGVLLAGEVGKSKAWKLTNLKQQVGTNAVIEADLELCFLDNIYTFSNNANQDYAAAEGTTSCPGGYPANMEYGTWAFTIDGLTVTIAVDETYSPYGLFSPEPITDDNGNAYNIGYPYPATVKTLNATQMVLEQNETIGSTKFKFTMTFVAI